MLWLCHTSLLLQHVCVLSSHNRTKTFGRLGYIYLKCWFFFDFLKNMKHQWVKKRKEKQNYSDGNMGLNNSETKQRQYIIVTYFILLL